MAKYAATLVNAQYYYVEFEADSLEEAEDQASEYLTELGTSIMPYDGESYVDDVIEEENA